MQGKPPRSPTSVIDVAKLVSRIRSQFGVDAVSVPGREPDFMLKQVSAWVDCGQELNPIVGNSTRGIACGFYTELAGAESAGKTTLGYYLLGMAQRAGCVTILADIEHSYNQDWAKKQGVINENLLVLSTTHVTKKEVIVDNVDEQFKKWEIILKEAASLYGVPIVLLVDSLAALLPKEWQQGDYGERGVAALARALAMNVPKFQGVLLNTNTSCIFVNQLRDKIGVMFGEKETTVGGRAKNFYFFSRLSMSKVKTVKTGEKAVGIVSRVKNKKNKLDKPFKSLEVYIDFDSGLALKLP